MKKLTQLGSIPPAQSSFDYLLYGPISRSNNNNTNVVAKHEKPKNKTRRQQPTLTI